MTKTNFNNKLFSLQIKYKEFDIDQLSETKYLGTHIKKQLNWARAQITSVKEIIDLPLL